MRLFAKYLILFVDKCSMLTIVILDGLYEYNSILVCYCFFYIGLVTLLIQTKQNNYGKINYKN